MSLLSPRNAFYGASLTASGAAAAFAVPTAAVDLTPRLGSGENAPGSEQTELEDAEVARFLQRRLGRNRAGRQSQLRSLRKGRQRSMKSLCGRAKLAKGRASVGTAVIVEGQQYATEVLIACQQTAGECSTKCRHKRSITDTLRRHKAPSTEAPW